MHEREIVLRLALPANEECTEAIVPTAGALDDPASCAPAHPAQERLLTLLPDVRRDAPLAYDLIAVAEVVALVETEMHRPPWPARCVQHDRVECRRQAPFVVQVGRAQDRRERDTARIGKDVPLGAELRAVCRVRSGELPPFGALTMKPSSAAHFH